MAHDFYRKYIEVGSILKDNCNSLRLQTGIKIPAKSD